MKSRDQVVNNARRRKIDRRKFVEQRSLKWARARNKNWTVAIVIISVSLFAISFIFKIVNWSVLLN